MRNSIRAGQLVLKTGPFNVRVASVIPEVIDGLAMLYADFPQSSSEQFADYYVRIFQPSGLRRFWRPQVMFAFDQFTPFKPLPYSQSLPFFEWGFNWCISGYAHQFLIIHAAVVEKNGKALILPGIPGAGKSTLCAALIHSGWRLLSDELTLVDRESGQIIPVPRPVSLKNESIDLIKTAFQDAVFSPTVDDTIKGSVALMKPLKIHIEAMKQSAKPAFIIFPRYQKDVQLELKPVDKAGSFMRIADLSFNYPVLGAEGFVSLENLVKQCETYDFIYDGNFDHALRCFDNLLIDEF